MKLKKCKEDQPGNKFVFIRNHVATIRASEGLMARFSYVYWISEEKRVSVSYKYSKWFKPYADSQKSAYMRLTLPLSQRDFPDKLSQFSSDSGRQLD